MGAGSCSQAVSTQTFKVLDEAAAVLSALHALHIPLALLMPAQSSKAVTECLEDTKMLGQFASVVSICCMHAATGPLSVCEAYHAPCACWCSICTVVRDPQPRTSDFACAALLALSTG
jgi:hypothetical protein